MKFDIRKATGRNDSSKRQMEVSKSSNNNNPEEKRNNINSKLELFETIVSHNYLSHLSEYPILPMTDKETGMGWYRITRIVLDRDKFFPDQLSMLYTALHDVAKNVALVIHKKDYDDIDLYLGARDFEGSLQESSTLLKSAIQGYLPGVKSEQSIDKQFIFDTNKNYYVASYSGIASLRDDKKEDFIQGVEKFIDATPSIPSFTAFFIADNVSEFQAKNMIKAFSSLHDVFSPLMQCQETISQSETIGVSDTFTESISETISETLSETITRTEGTNHNYSKSNGSNKSYGSNKKPNILKSIYRSIFGGEIGEQSSKVNVDQVSEQTGNHVDIAKGNIKSSDRGKTKGKDKAHGSHHDKTKGISKQITRSNMQVKHYVELLERHIERLHNGIPYGLWSVGTYFVSPDNSTSRKLANIYRGCITGENSNLDSIAINLWDANSSKCLLQYLQDTQNPRFNVDNNINVSCCEIVTSKELAIHLSLPQTSIPGVEVKECASFGRNLNGKNSLNKIPNGLKIGHISHLGNVSKKEVIIDTEEISKHVFVTGSTGSGKSNTVYLLINELLKKDKHILIVEPTKGDYRKVFGGRKDFTVYTTRNIENNILRINPFVFPENIHIVEHVERLVEILGVCWPMYAAMPAVLKDSILSAYEACGWNLKKSTCRFGKLFPTISDVIIQLKRIISLSEYSNETKGDYIGALQTRLESLTNGIYSSVLSSTQFISYSDLYDKNVIIDLHNIGSSETRSLLMGLIVLGLTEWRMSQSEDIMNQELQHVTVLEEAHCILPRVSKQQNQEGANILGKSVEMISSAIAEMRTYGESFIIVDQSPSSVDESAIRNTNTKIVMNLPDGEDRNIAGKAIALIKDEQIAELARLSTGEAIVWQRGWSEAVFTSIDEMSIRTPLPSKYNAIENTEEDNQITSSKFINYFVNGRKELNAEDTADLNLEVLQASCPSSTKAILLDTININVKHNSRTLREAIIDYLGLKDILIRKLYSYTDGSTDLIWDLREYMASNLCIIDTNVQNKLLSMSFIWASLQNKKWHIICYQSLPSFINTFK